MAGSCASLSSKQLARNINGLYVIKSTFIAILAALLSMAVIASAAQVTKQITVDWGYPVEQESTIAGFRLYNQAGAVVFDNAAPNLRTLTVPYTYDDTVPQAFHMVSVSQDNQLSTPSNIYVVKAPFKPLVGVGTITIKIQE